MRRAVTTLVVLLVASLPLPSTHAADPPEPPGPEHNTLWAHRDLVDDRFHHTMNTNANQSDIWNPGSDNPGDSWNWTITLDPPLERTLILDTNATIRFHIHIGGSTHLGVVDVSTALHYGETLIAQGDPQQHVFTPSGTTTEGVGFIDEYPLLQWEAPVQHDRLEPGHELVWTVSSQGQFTAIYMGMSPARGQSHIELPALRAETRAIEPSEDGDELVTPAPGLALVPLITALIIIWRRKHNPPGRAHQA